MTMPPCVHDNATVCTVKVPLALVCYFLVSAVTLRLAMPDYKELQKKVRFDAPCLACLLI
jgi:hypothetical protein